MVTEGAPCPMLSETLEEEGISLRDLSRSACLGAWREGQSLQIKE